MIPVLRLKRRAAHATCHAAALLILALPACAPRHGSHAPGPPPMVSAAEWGGVAPSPQDPAGRPQSRIHTLTVHHQGEFWVAGADVPAYLRRLQQWSRRAKSWVDVPYHYIIAPDGAIYQGRPPGLAGDSNTDYDTQGHLQVMLLGNFEIQQPSQAQWNSAVRLLSHLMLAHGLRPQDLAAHRHHTGQTVCPGANLLERFEELRRSLPQP